MPEQVEIVEVGARDGLQNEPRLVSTQDKIRLVDHLSACGFARIEVASFVRSDRVPQMADGADILARIQRHAGTHYSALVPNLQGFTAAVRAGTDAVAVFASASEGFSRHNINCSIAESLDRFRPVFAEAARIGMPVRGYVSCITDCPYDGPVAPDAVVRVATALLQMGCAEISLGDTLGRATPERVALLLDAVVPEVPAPRLAGHFHDTGNRALENIAVALRYGLRVFDAAIGGLGGCPFAPGAKGNVETLRVHDYLAASGLHTGLDRAALVAAGEFAHKITR